MTEEVLRLGVDPRAAEAGFRRYDAAASRSGRATSEMDAHARRMSATVGTLRTALVGLAATLGAGLSFRAAINLARDFESAQSDLIIRTGKTGEALRGLESDARDIFRAVPQDIATVSAVLGELDTRVKGTRGEIQGLARDVLDFSRITRQDAVTATRDLSQLMAALDVPVGGATVLFDQLTYAAQTTGIEVGTLTRAIIEAGPAFAQMGFGVERSIALFSQFEQVGARPQEVISSLNMALTRMAQSGATDAEAAFSQLLDSIRDAPDLLSAVTIAADAFGSRVGAKVAEDIRAGTFEVDEFVAGMREAGGVFRSTADAALTSSDRIATAMNGIRADVGEVVAELLEGLVPAVEALTHELSTHVVPLIRDTADGFQALGNILDTWDRRTAGFRAFVDQVVRLQQGLRIGEGAARVLEESTRLERDLLFGTPSRGSSDPAMVPRDSVQQAQELAGWMKQVADDIARGRGEQERATAAAKATADEAARQAEAARLAAEEQAKALRERVSLVTLAVDLDVKHNGLMGEAIGHAARLARIARDTNRTLAERVEAQVALNDVSGAILGSFDRQLESSLELRDATVQIRDLWKEVPEWMNKAAEPLNTLPDVAKDGANAFRDHWLTAIQVVGAGIGGLASQLANVAGAFATGGMAGGIVAASGLVGSALFGGRSDEIRKAEEAYEKALDSFVDTLTERSRWERLERDAAATAEAVLDRYIKSLSPGEIKKFHRPIIENRERLRDGGDIEEVLTMFGPEGQAILEAYRAKLQQIAEQRQRDIDSMQESIAVRLLVAQGRDAEADVLRESIARQQEWAKAVELGGITVQQSLSELWLMEDARRAELAVMREAAREFAETMANLSLEAREAALAGDDTAQAIARATEVRDRERRAVEEAYAAEEIGIDTLNRWIEVIQGEYLRAVEDATAAEMTRADTLRDSARAAYEAAQAEAFRNGQDMQQLQIRLLRAQGRDAEIQQLQRQMEMERALFDGRDSAYLQMLQQVQAEEARAKAMQSATAAVRETTRSMQRMTTAINAPTGFRLSLARHQASDPFRAVSSATPNFGSTTHDESTTINGNVIVQMPAGATEADWDQLLQWAAKKKRASGVNPFQLAGA